MIRLGTVVLGAEQVERAVAFWSEALSLEPVWFDEAENGFTILRPPSGEGTRIAIQQSDTAADLRLSETYRLRAQAVAYGLACPHC